MAEDIAVSVPVPRRKRRGQVMALVFLLTATIMALAVAATAWALGARRLPDIERAIMIGAGGCLCLFMVYHHTKSRFRAMGCIQTALRDNLLSTGPRDALRLREDMGPEALAWNKLLAEADAVNATKVANRTREALGDRRSSPGDFEAACESLSIGMIIVDSNLCARQTNGAAAALLQMAREQVVGAELSKLVQDAEVNAAVAAVAGGSGQRRTFEVQRAEASGQTILRIQVRPTRRGDAGGVLVTFEDITQQRLADAARNTFITQATHELRAPLTNMRLCLETAIEDLDERPAAMREHLNVLNHESRRLERMVSEMLSIAEIEAGSLRLKTDDVRLNKLFEELGTDFTRMAAEKQITLKFDLPPKMPVLQGDRDKLMLSLQNLLGNAIKYTPAGGTVSVSLREEGGQLAIDVTDTGIGIRPEECGRIFERFYRAEDARVSKITGTGLGLSLAREVARLHGGDVSVQSEIDKGSIFTLTLPPAVKAA
jgi:PAS domain S-box-containing protein